MGEIAKIVIVACTVALAVGFLIDAAGRPWGWAISLIILLFVVILIVRNKG